jgi:hypothetical protein
VSRPSETACTLATFVSETACFKILSQHEQQALMVYFKVLQLDELGGTDYTAELGPNGELNQDATAYRTMDRFTRNLARLWIEKDNAVSSGATVSEDIQVLKEAIECLVNFDQTKLDAMDLLLTCQLGRHAAMPQVNL